jgi:catechol 2,3-dioxygenase-like lactoylglutathione lyase family enzyme
VILGVKYVHTNLVAHDWRSLATFYQEVLGCIAMPPERNLSGPDYERGTGVQGAHARGIHLLLPGHGPSGPTLEIFQYTAPVPGLPSVVHQPGFGHVAFAVTSVVDARSEFLAAGGSSVGEVIQSRISPDTVVTWCYVRDPEGNIVELQSRARTVPDL